MAATEVASTDPSDDTIIFFEIFKCETFVKCKVFCAAVKCGDDDADTIVAVFDIPDAVDRAVVSDEFCLRWTICNLWSPMVFTF